MTTHSAWVPYAREKWHRQPLPQERRWVLLILAAQPERGLPEGVAAGYMKFGAGEKDSPYFIIPGIGGEVIAWCDCLSDNFRETLYTTVAALTSDGMDAGYNLIGNPYPGSFDEGGRP